MDEDRIERLLAAGKITDGEAERLRRAFLESEAANAPLPPSPWLRPPRLLILGTLVLVLTFSAYLAGRALSLGRVNLVRNGGFEEGDREPAHWTAQSLSGEADFLLESDAAPEGRRFGRIRKSGERVLPIDSWIQDVGPVPPSRFIAVSLWARASRAQMAGVALAFDGGPSGPQHRVVAELQGTSGWRRIDRELRAPDGAASMLLAIQMHGSGEVDVDGVRIEPIPGFRFAPGEELVSNPGFEEGPAGAPRAWAPTRTPDGVRFSIESAGERGRHAAIVSRIPTDRLAFIWWSQTLDRFPTGAEIRFGASLRASASGIANVMLVASDGSGRPVLSMALVAPDEQIGTLEWHRYERTLSLPFEAREVSLRCVLEGIGTASFDDVSLQVR